MPSRRTADPAVEVDRFLATSDHPAVPLIGALRRIVLDADPSIGEGIKWNAPSFRTNEYFATTHLREKHGIGLILHFGAKKTAIATTGVEIADPAGLLQWLAKDRAIVRFADEAALAAQRAALQGVLREWIRYVG